MARLRFIHAADLHLDSPFRGIRSEAPAHVADALHRATFEAYANIIDLCLRERVDALLVAGDIYDGADRSLRAQLRFVDGLSRLAEAGVRSFICHGNHDPLDGWEARLDLPPGSVRFGAEVASVPVFLDEPERAQVHGISYPTRDVRENLALLFGGQHSTGYDVGLLHANAGGNSDHESYAPCSVADLIETGMDYWALGHVHTRQVLRQDRPTVVYPGNPQGRNPRETGARGVYLVEVDDHGSARLDFRAVDTVRWQMLGVNIGGLDSEQMLLDAIDYAVAGCSESNEGRPSVYRMALTGRGPLNGWLRRPDTVPELREQINERYSNGYEWLWCERIELDTASQVDREQVALREDFVGDLVRLSTATMDDPEEIGELRALLRPLYGANRTRNYLRDLIPDDQELRSLIAQAEADCLTELIDDEEEG